MQLSHPSTFQRPTFPRFEIKCIQLQFKYWINDFFNFNLLSFGTYTILYVEYFAIFLFERRWISVKWILILLLYAAMTSQPSTGNLNFGIVLDSEWSFLMWTCIWSFQPNPKPHLGHANGLSFSIKLFWWNRKDWLN